MSNEQKSTPKKKPMPKLERIGALKLERIGGSKSCEKIGPPRPIPRPRPRTKK